MSVNYSFRTTDGFEILTSAKEPLSDGFEILTSAKKSCLDAKKSEFLNSK